MDDKTAKQEESESEEKKESDLAPFKSEHQLARGFVQQLGQALIQWLPVGSSSFILVSFLLQQNWLMVVVTLPITAIAVFWASFTRTLLSKIQEMGKKMGEESGTFLEKWLRAILEGIRWQFAGTEENYLRCLVGLKQISSPNKAETGFISGKHIPIVEQPLKETERHRYAKSCQGLNKSV
jgi:hypothetical protein